MASTYHVVQEDERWYCHVLNADNQTIRIRAHFRLIWQRAWDPRLTFYNPYLITCGLPNDYDIGVENAFVTLRGKKCPPKGSDYLRINLVPKWNLMTWRQCEFLYSFSRKCILFCKLRLSTRKGQSWSLCKRTRLFC